MVNKRVVYGNRLENNTNKKRERRIEHNKRKDASIERKELIFKKEQRMNVGQQAGTTFGSISSSGNMYNHDKYATPRGHGFAAEDANHLHDTIHGKKASLVGADNAKHGADRIVNGTEIQTKYCKTGSKCISECFENGQLKYLNSEGTPMQIEVPSDKYVDAVKAMENRIRKGEVKGVTNPAEAKNIVRQGNYTYEQVKNIAKSGNIDSIKFDATNGAVIATTAFGISATISFAVSIWNGEDVDIALKSAAFSGIKVGSVTFISAVVSSQLSKAGLNSALVASSEQIVSLIGPKASAILVNALRSGQNIYGAAAMKSAAKLLRGNVITGIVTGVVLETVDIVDIFRGRISGKQLFKNSLETASTIAGGSAGWVAGATAGAALGTLVPIVGNAVGGIIGGIVGSVGGGVISAKATKTVTGLFLEDDAEEMVRIIEKEFSIIANNYLLNREEVEEVAIQMQSVLKGKTLKDMYNSPSKIDFADNLIIPIVENIVTGRKKIISPSVEDFSKGIQFLLEDNLEDHFLETV
ncbi:hypothetical protein [Vagococcus salmoninarum]|uniref:hypothetical protein n=1 Tax=Vagococcus salmoninarum TaxID=2739 RepID=UPI001880A53A|nr:hypothetical protein [Vagococcus salmoninarum]MBE9390295.1 hypothetical protein [Vagococcus salmoninarum]